MSDQKQKGLQIRYTEPEDAPYLKSWFSEQAVLRWFPMCDDVEIEDAVKRWIYFHRYKCSLTAVKDGVPCGLATLYLQPYRKLAHQCEFGIIVDQNYRNQGVGTALLERLTYLAKTTFGIEVLHLQVYSSNPAIHLYERLGFTPFGEQTRWIKEPDGNYRGRVFMEKYLTEEKS